MTYISPTKEALDCKTNSPCQYNRKCIENSVEKMYTDVRVKDNQASYARFAVDQMIQHF